LLNVTQNDYVAEGDILATVVQPASLVIQLNVPFEYENAVKWGQLAKLYFKMEETTLQK
jgi:hypothetical protein